MPKATVNDISELPEVLTMEQVQDVLGSPQLLLKALHRLAQLLPMLPSPWTSYSPAPTSWRLIWLLSPQLQTPQACRLSWLP